MSASESGQDVDHHFPLPSELLLALSLSSLSPSKKVPPLTSSLDRLTLHDPIRLWCQVLSESGHHIVLKRFLKRGTRACTRSHKPKQLSIASACSPSLLPLLTVQLTPLAKCAFCDRIPQVGAGKGRYKPLLLHRSSRPVAIFSVHHSFYCLLLPAITPAFLAANSPNSHSCSLESLRSVSQIPIFCSRACILMSPQQQESTDPAFKVNQNATEDQRQPQRVASLDSHPELLSDPSSIQGIPSDTGDI